MILVGLSERAERLELISLFPIQSLNEGLSIFFPSFSTTAPGLLSTGRRGFQKSLRASRGRIDTRFTLSAAVGPEESANMSISRVQSTESVETTLSECERRQEQEAAGKQFFSWSFELSEHCMAGALNYSYIQQLKIRTRSLQTGFSCRLAHVAQPTC